MSEENKAAARAEFEIWEVASSTSSTLWSPDVIHHDPYDPYAADGLEGLKKSIALNRTAFPDIRITVEDQVAEGDKVTTRWTADMTHRASSEG